MFKLVLVTGCAAIVLSVVAAPEHARAQRTSNGMFGSRTMGSSLTPGTRTFNQGGRSAFGGGGSMRPGAGRGVAGAGGAEMGDVGGILNGSERFVRGNRQNQFVGVDSADVQNNLSSFQGGFGNQAFGPGGRAGFARNRAQQQQFAPQRNMQQETQVRISYHAAFSHPEPAAVKVRATVAKRLRRSLGDSFTSPLKVEFSGGVITLRGFVATKHERHLAELMAGLEPGVDRVQNELRLASTRPPLD